MIKSHTKYRVKKKSRSSRNYLKVIKVTGQKGKGHKRCRAIKGKRS